MTQINILGASGSIGSTVIELIKENKKRFNVGSMVVNSNLKKLLELSHQLKPKIVAIADKNQYSELKASLPSEVKALAGEEGILEAANLASDLTVSGISGFAGLQPTWEALKNSDRIALANKECLVTGGSLFMQEAEKHSCKILPADSEHFALQQILKNKNIKELKKATLTASGGSLLNRALPLDNVTVSEVCNHPVWKMGNKITVDSATLMNKALEIIEASYLFKLKPEKLSAVIHPQAIIHALAEFNSGEMIAHMASPSMRLSLGYCLYYPDEAPCLVKPLALDKIASLNFIAIDKNRFPAFNLAFTALEKGGHYPIWLNASNEIAVESFLAHKTNFIHIIDIIKNCLSETPEGQPKNLDEIIASDKQARITATKYIN